MFGPLRFAFVEVDRNEELVHAVCACYGALVHGFNSLLGIPGGA